MPTLYDHKGKPVNVASLGEERAVGSTTGVRTPFDPEVTIGLTPEKLRNLLKRAREGDHQDYLAMAAEMERRDPHYYSVLQTRKLAIFQLDRDVTPTVENDATEDAIAEEVRSFIKSPMFGLALLNILDGLGKGFSVNEIIWEKDENRWTPVEIKYRNPRWFMFDSDTAEELRLYNGTAEGLPLDPFKYIIHRPQIVSGLDLAGGLARIVAAMHLFKGYAIKDWMAFAEVFGMPIRIGKFDQGATAEQKEELKKAVRDIGSDAAAIIPNTMEIVFERANMSGNAGSDKFFSDLHDTMNKEVSKAVLGQTMTVEDGSSLAQASIHNEVRVDIRNADAIQVANTVNRDLVKPFIDLNFGARRKSSDYPQFAFDIEEPEDMKLLSESLPPFIQLGLPVMQKTILDMFGLPEPEEGQPLLSTGGSGGGAPSEEDQQQRFRTLLQWVENEAKQTTNMRVFRKKLAERIGEL